MGGKTLLLDTSFQTNIPKIYIDKREIDVQTILCYVNYLPEITIFGLQLLSKIEQTWSGNNNERDNGPLCDVIVTK